VAIGAAVLLFLLGLILQRRRARAIRRARLRNPPKKVQTVQAEATPVVAAPSRVKPAVAAATAPVATKEAAATLASPAEPVSSSRRPERVEPVSEELKKLMAGGDYDEKVLASEDRETRQVVGAELLSALVGRNLQRRERARAAFMKHGYFDDATRDLRVAESANERAAAARRLSFVHDREATPHLIAALDDSSPDVRRAAVEALMDLRDPAAIAPLNSMMQNENDRKVPRNLIHHAIESCATGSADEPPSISPVSSSSAVVPAPVASAVEIEREVIEI
jgi:HEAT repeat protein